MLWIIIAVVVVALAALAWWSSRHQRPVDGARLRKGFRDTQNKAIGEMGSGGERRYHGPPGGF